MSGDARSEYAIENLLPEGQHRFLKIRDEFMRITNRRVVDACVLEMLRFESERLLRKMSPDARTTEFNLFYNETGPLADSELWVPLPSKRVLERLCGFAASERTVERSLRSLAEAGLIVLPEVQRRGGAFRRVLLNFPKVSAAVRKAGFTEAEWNAGTEAIKGTVSMLALPDARYHALYPTLVEGIRLVTSESGAAPARMSLLLLRASWLADEAVRRGQDPAPSFSRTRMLPMMGFGQKDAWWNHLAVLAAGSDALLIRREDLESHGSRRYQPNLEAIQACIDLARESRDRQELANATIRVSQCDNPGQSMRQSGSVNTTDLPVVPDKPAEGGHIPEPSPEPQKQLREGNTNSEVESLSLLIPRKSLPRFDSRFRGGRSVRDTGIPRDLWALDLRALGIRESVAEQCSTVNGQPLVLSGGFSTGKSVLAAALVWAVMEKEGSPAATWIDVESVMPLLRSLDFNSDGYKTAMAELVAVPASGPVVLDGVEDTGGRRNLLDGLVAALQRTMVGNRLVVVTTHLLPDEFERAFGPKMGARLRNESVIVDCRQPIWESRMADVEAAGS